MSEDPQVRVLQCWVCSTLEEIPDYDGIPEDDAFLYYVDEKHGGQTEHPHNRALHRVSLKHWSNDKVRAQIAEQMWAGETGFKPEWYARHDTLSEDALNCFTAHKRQTPCMDYRDSSKRIGNPAARDRSLLARALKRDVQDLGPGPQAWLCQWCPVESFVNAKKHEKNELHTY